MHVIITYYAMKYRRLGGVEVSGHPEEKSCLTVLL